MSGRPERDRTAAYALATLLAISGVLHIVIPAPYRSIVPDGLGSPAFWVAASGAAELVCAVGLLVRSSRRIAGWATAALFVAVFPANVAMAVDAFHGDGSVAVALLRLPLQVPLIVWALAVARRARDAPSRR